MIVVAVVLCSIAIALAGATIAVTTAARRRWPPDNRRGRDV